MRLCKSPLKPNLPDKKDRLIKKNQKTNKQTWEYFKTGGNFHQKKEKRQHHSAFYQTGKFQKNWETNEQDINGSNLACKRKKNETF